MTYKKIIRKVIKNIFGIDGISLFIKKKKKSVLKNVYTKKYGTQDLISEMKKMGMKRDSVVFIHSSMSEFYNYKGNAQDFISSIIEVIGPSGTLLMPAYPANKKKLFKKAEDITEIVFDSLNTPSGAGYLSEVFRKMPGVKRSINLQHSVCAFGKDAEYFTKDHHLSEDAWDEKSPYYKLTKIKGLIFSFGLESYLRNVTLIHTIESYFKNKYKYFADFFGKKLTYSYLDSNGNMGNQTLNIPVKGGVRDENIIKKYFNKDSFKRSKLSNLQIEMIESDYMFSKCKELIENGISIYKSPIYTNYIMNNKFIKIDETKY